MVAKHEKQESAGKPRLRSLAALAATFSVVASIVAFNNYATRRQSEFCANLMYHESDPD